MRYLTHHPLIATTLVAALILASVFSLQWWMTNRAGNVDGKASITAPPT